jgi:hypothetical protein
MEGIGLTLLAGQIKFLVGVKRHSESFQVD